MYRRMGFEQFSSTLRTDAGNYHNLVALADNATDLPESRGAIERPCARIFRRRPAVFGKKSQKPVRTLRRTRGFQSEQQRFSNAAPIASFPPREDPSNRRGNETGAVPRCIGRYARSFRLIRLGEARPSSPYVKTRPVGRGVRQKGLTVRSSHAVNVSSVKRIHDRPTGGQRMSRGSEGKEREELYLHNRLDSQKSMISWPDKDGHL